MEKEMQYSKFRQTIYALSYYYDIWDDKIEKRSIGKKIRTEIICQCNIALPLLHKDEKFYIEELDRIVEIKAVYRTSKDNVLYIVNDDYEDDTDEAMKLSYESVQLEMESYKEKQKANEEKYNLEYYKKESFWYRLFHKYEDYDYNKR